MMKLLRDKVSLLILYFTLVFTIKGLINGVNYMGFFLITIVWGLREVYLYAKTWDILDEEVTDPFERDRIGLPAYPIRKKHKPPLSIRIVTYVLWGISILFIIFVTIKILI